MGRPGKKVVEETSDKRSCVGIFVCDFLFNMRLIKLNDNTLLDGCTL